MCNHPKNQKALEMANPLHGKNKGNIVLEMIDFQLNDKFGRDMELHITEIVAAVKEKFPDKLSSNWTL